MMTKNPEMNTLPRENLNDKIGLEIFQKIHTPMGNKISLHKHIVIYSAVWNSVSTELRELYHDD